MSKKGQLIVVSGPSGVGKGTVLGAYLAGRENVAYSVSATTRAPRPGEQDGVHYFFLSREEFESTAQNGGMLEYASYNGNYYGTPKSEVDKRIAAHTTVILVIEVVGATNIKRLYPGATTIFIQPPSYAELEERLRGRGTESEQAIQSRLARAAEEMSYATDYDEVVVNDDVDRCADEIYRLIQEHQHT